MKQKKVCLGFRRKRLDVEVHECNFFEKGLGLMVFRKNLLFSFQRPTRGAIHSLFCQDFYAVWLDDNFNILEVQLVRPWRVSIQPQKRFSKLIEIPITDQNREIIEFLVGARKV